MSKDNWGKKLHTNKHYAVMELLNPYTVGVTDRLVNYIVINTANEAVEFEAEGLPQAITVAENYGCFLNTLEEENAAASVAKNGNVVDFKKDE